MAVCRIDVAGSAGGGGQRSAVAGGVIGIGFDRRSGGSALGLVQTTQAVVGVLGQGDTAGTVLEFGDRTDRVIAVTQRQVTGDRVEHGLRAVIQVQRMLQLPTVAVGPAGGRAESGVVGPG